MSGAVLASVVGLPNNSCQVQLWNVTIKGTVYYAGYEGPGTQGAYIQPTTVGGATINEFAWGGTASNYSGNGQLILYLAGNTTGMPTHGAIVGGVNMGTSGMANFSGIQTSYQWGNSTNPFGATAGAYVSVTIT